jgi:hypothetical protein
MKEILHAAAQHDDFDYFSRSFPLLRVSFLFSLSKHPNEVSPGRPIGDIVPLRA